MVINMDLYTYIMLKCVVDRLFEREYDTAHRQARRFSRQRLYEINKRLKELKGALLKET